MSRCTAHAKQTQERCARPAIAGGNVCLVHGGSAPGVKRKAAVRAFLTEWGTNDSTVDPGEQLLRMVAQSSRRAEFYAAQLAQEYNENGLAALVLTTKDGAEYIRSLVAIEAAERKMLADFVSRALAAGLAERAVQVAEQTGAAVIAAVNAALDRAGIVGPALLEARNTAALTLLEFDHR